MPVVKTGNLHVQTEPLIAGEPYVVRAGPEGGKLDHIDRFETYEDAMQQAQLIVAFREGMWTAVIYKELAVVTPEIEWVTRKEAA